jgi:hypothetical protein
VKTRYGILTVVQCCATILLDPRFGIKFAVSIEMKSHLQETLIVRSMVEAQDFPGTEWADKGRGFGTRGSPRREAEQASVRDIQLVPEHRSRAA